MKTETIFFRIMPLNEGQELNYHESNYISIPDLLERCNKMQKDLQKALPQASITIKIENKECTKYWYFDNGTIYDSDYNEVKTNLLKPNQNGNKIILQIN